MARTCLARSRATLPRETGRYEHCSPEQNSVLKTGSFHEFGSLTCGIQYDLDVMAWHESIGHIYVPRGTVQNGNDAEFEPQNVASLLAALDSWGILRAVWEDTSLCWIYVSTAFWCPSCMFDRHNASRIWHYNIVHYVFLIFCACVHVITSIYQYIYILYIFIWVIYAAHSLNYILRHWYWEFLPCPLPAVSTPFNASFWDVIHDGLLFTNVNGGRW